MNDPRYPIGKPELPAQLDDDKRDDLIEAISELPTVLRAAVRGLNNAQLDTPYREGGWTVRQVVHHVADSHINSYVRFKLAMTEDKPPIKGYDENEWAKLSDNRMPPEVSLQLLEALHTRWADMLRSMKPADFQRKLVHSERGELTLDSMVSLYAWHGRHHTAHITQLRKAKGW